MQELLPVCLCFRKKFSLETRDFWTQALAPGNAISDEFLRNNDFRILH